MPTLRVELFEGRSAEQKRELIAALTAATVRVLDCPPDAVDIVLSEVRRDHWATGGVMWSERQD